MATVLSSNNDDANDNGSSWSSTITITTNWTIAGGSLDASVTFESFDSPIDSETVDSKGKSPLILKSPSPDCGPCEINISFAQKHEIRQVYVRSTARVYEIYFAPSLQSCNEYLCTVRCAIAARDGVFHATDAQEPAGAHSRGSAGEQAKEKCSDDGTVVSSEDDWIEVKVPDSELQVNLQNSMPKKFDASSRTNVQDFFEATAEISDADACISLTLRLLSLQSKGCIYVDEIYVFADPVDLADLETQESQVGNSAGSSLVAMLVPTLLQLSKTGHNRRPDKHASDTLEKGENLETGSRITDSTDIGNEIQQEESTAAQQDVKLSEVNEATPELPQFQIPAQVSDREQTHCFVAKTNAPFDHIERVLDQLVSRVSRVEDICLRFEESILKPINSMEARLQRVEQHVEMFTKNSQFSVLPSCTRISAPEFSCIGSNSSSFYNEGSDSPACGTLELERDAPSKNDTSSVNDTRFLPSLVVTAPEFSCGDDDEIHDALQVPEDCPKENMKHAMSIDDALAAALAGFLSTTTVQSSNYTKTLTVKAPEFTVEETDDDSKVASTGAQSEKPTVPPIFPCESNGTESLNDSVSTSTSTSSILSAGPVMENFSEDCTKDKSEGIDGKDQLDDWGSGGTLGTSVSCPTAQGEPESAETDDCQIAGSIHRAEASNGSSVSVCETTDFLKQFVGNQTEETSDVLLEAVAATCAEEVVAGSEEDELKNALKSSSTYSVVDFGLPILDVKFSSCESSGAKSILEALLINMPELDVEAPCVQQGDDAVTSDQSNLILVEDEEPNCPPTGSHLLAYWDSGNGRDVLSSVEGEAPLDSYACNKEEIFTSLI